MKIAISLVLFLSVTAIYSCRVRYLKADKDTIYHLPSINNNVCKKLKDKVVFYAVFVDSKYTSSWSEFDINSTLDSIKIATEWIEDEAVKNGINLDIEIDFHQNKKTIPIEMKLSKKSLSATLFAPNGIKNVDKWADKISKEALKAYGPDTSEVTKTKIKPQDREKLLARLRDIHQTDNVGLLFFINNFFTQEISVVLHSHEGNTPEYSVVSYKNTGTIAHEFLHLFGAVDLYLSPFDQSKRTRKKKEFAMKEFPNEIMAFPHRSLDSLEISQFTKYLIGWDNELDKRYKDLLIGRKFKIAKY